MTILKKSFKKLICGLSVFMLSACAPVDVPGTHTVDVPPAAKAKEKFHAFNENQDGITRLVLGEDVLVPQPLRSDPLPDIFVGPFELRSETLAGALQLILVDFDISLAFESERGLTERVTVANLSGRLPKVVERICGLADLYCSYSDGLLTVKETEKFVVDLPPIGDATAFGDVVTGLTEILDTGSSSSSDDNNDDSNSDSDSDSDGEPVIDGTTRVIVYQASHRTARYAEEYFKRLRKNTALIVYETHIWEVSLNNDNRTGINWDAMLTGVGNFDFDISIAGNNATGGATPITITPGFSGSDRLTSTQVFNFISEKGAVKTVSQPQLTLLSGATASLTVQNTENYVSEVTRTVDEDGDDSFSTETDSITTGLTLNITSAWDQSTVYGSVEISLDELLSLEPFPTVDGGTIQLPETTNRSLETQIRVRPGDAVVIAGLVQESDNYSASGPGFLKPLFNTSRAALTENSELVFMLRPRVIVFDTAEEAKARKLYDATASQSSMPMKDGASAAEPMDNGLDLGTLPLNSLAPVSLTPEREQ